MFLHCVLICVWSKKKKKSFHRQIAADFTFRVLLHFIYKCGKCCVDVGDTVCALKKQWKPNHASTCVSETWSTRKIKSVICTSIATSTHLIVGLKIEMCSFMWYLPTGIFRSV